MIKGSDTTLNAAEIIKARGFQAEWYPILSYDGTPLSMYHVVNPLADPATLNYYPVLIMHGFTGDGTQMIAHSHNVRARKPVVGWPSFDPTDENLPFAMANNNFDVWLMDFRGSNSHNPYFREHVRKIGTNKFWNFTIDDQLLNDVPAAINFVLQQTQTPMLHYVGYSESTFYMFALLSTFPDLANKLVSFVAMAPVAYTSHVKGVLPSMVVPYLLVPDDFGGDFTPSAMQQTVSNMFDSTCRSGIMRNTVCAAFTTVIGGFGQSDNQADFYGALFKASSIKSIKQLAQLYLSGRFGMYDFGPLGNLKHYGQDKPPDYDVSKIRMPRIIFVRGGKDFLSNPEDQEILLKKLTVKPYKDFQIPDYNHWDFLMGKNLTEKISVPVINAIYEILRSFGNGYVTIRAGEPTKVVQPGAVFPPDPPGTELPMAGYNGLPLSLDGSNGQPSGGQISPMNAMVNTISEAAGQVGQGLVKQTKDLTQTLTSPIDQMLGKGGK